MTASKPQERVAVVTGGGSGIGRALVHAFAAEGRPVAILDVSRERATAVQAEVESLGGVGVSLACDVASAAEVHDVAAEIHREWGPAGVLCNNAGIGGGVSPPLLAFALARANF